ESSARRDGEDAAPAKRSVIAEAVEKADGKIEVSDETQGAGAVRAHRPDLGCGRAVRPRRMPAYEDDPSAIRRPDRRLVGPFWCVCNLALARAVGVHQPEVARRNQIDRPVARRWPTCPSYWLLRPSPCEGHFCAVLRSGRLGVSRAGIRRQVVADTAREVDPREVFVAVRFAPERAREDDEGASGLPGDGLTRSKRRAERDRASAVDRDG